MTKERQELNRNLAQMLKGGVIMDVTTPEQARIAEQASAVDTITGEDITGEEVIYDLRGIRVVNPVGGIYIING
ncbi:MAG: pyridoxal 5'-phosphate synthase lyase subunit PdxS, partial [Prevotella sp.]